MRRSCTSPTIAIFLGVFAFFDTSEAECLLLCGCSVGSVSQKAFEIGLIALTGGVDVVADPVRGSDLINMECRPNKWQSQSVNIVSRPEDVSTRRFGEARAVPIAKA